MRNFFIQCIPTANFQQLHTPLFKQFPPRATIFQNEQNVSPNSPVIASNGNNARNARQRREKQNERPSQLVGTAATRQPDFPPPWRAAPRVSRFPGAAATVNSVGGARAIVKQTRARGKFALARAILRKLMLSNWAGKAACAHISKSRSGGAARRL